MSQGRARGLPVPYNRQVAFAAAEIRTAVWNPLAVLATVLLAVAGIDTFHYNSRRLAAPIAV